MDGMKNSSNGNSHATVLLVKAIRLVIEKSLMYLRIQRISVFSKDGKVLKNIQRALNFIG
jgi:hypothetical protein